MERTIQTLESSLPSSNVSEHPPIRTTVVIPKVIPAERSIHLHSFPSAECPPLSGNQTKMNQELKLMEQIVRAATTEWTNGKGVGGQEVTAEGGLREPDFCSPSVDAAPCCSGQDSEGQAQNQWSDILGTPASRLCSRPTFPGLPSK